MDRPGSPDCTDATFSVDRLASLSDGVFAVAMTLLAYNVRVPHGPLPEAQLLARLADALPDIRALILSFCAAAMFWRGHQNLLRLMRNSGRTLLMPTLAFLLSLVFLPISTSLYGAFGAAKPVAWIYGANLALIASLQLLLRFCVLSGERRSLPAWLRALAPSLYTSAVFILSVLFSFIEPRMSEALWYAAFGAPIVARLTQDEKGSQPQKI